jgi:peptidoglycan/LPS O-acetylase OafA/YrhL
MTHGTINLVAFYKRRAFRILPVYYFFLLVYAITESHSTQTISVWQWLANLTFTANYSSAQGPTGHLWTLGVEEQFYLIWPFVFLLAFRKNAESNWQNQLILGLACVLIACPLLRGVCYLFPKDSIPAIVNPFSFLRHADEIGWGCMAALCLWTRPHWWTFFDERRYFVSGLGTIMILIPWFAGPINGFNLINVPLGPSIQCVGYAALMLCSISSPSSPLFFWLNLRSIAILGTLSYSLYIWHTMFIPQRDGWPTLTFGPFSELPWWPMMALAMAACSFWGLEKPFLTLRRKLTNHR